MSPRHSLNGGGPISAQAVLDGDSWSNGSRAYEHTLLRNYQRVSLVAEDSVSCIVGALLRDGIAFEIHERRVSTLRVRAPAEGMRAATLILRIPGSAFIAVSGLLEGRLLDYALRLRGSGGSSASGGDALVDELSDRWGADEAAKCSAQTKTRRFALDQLELASTRPNLTAATIQRVLLPRVDPSAACTGCSDPHAALSIGIRLVGNNNRLVVTRPRHPEDAKRLRLFERYLKLLRGDFAVRSYWNWEPFMDFHTGILMRDCLPTLKVLERERIEFFLADQGDRNSFMSIFWQEPHSATVLEAVCIDWPLPLGIKGGWKDLDVDFDSCREARPTTINEASHPQRWKAMRQHASALGLLSTKEPHRAEDAAEGSSPRLSARRPFASLADLPRFFVQGVKSLVFPPPHITQAPVSVECR